MRYFKRTLGLTAIAFLLASQTTDAKTPMKMGKIKDPNSIIITNKTMMAKKVAGDFAAYTLYINDKVNINNELYYRVQTSEDLSNAIGYVRAQDLDIQNVKNAPLKSDAITLEQSTKVYNVPNGTERQVIDRAAKGATINADEAITVDSEQFVHGTFSNGISGWIKVATETKQKPEQKAAIKKTVQPKVEQKQKQKPKTEETPTSEAVSAETPVLPEGAAAQHYTVPITLDGALAQQLKLSPKPQTSNGVKWMNAKKDSVLKYLDTEQLIDDPINKYQFLVLNEPQGLTAEQLNVLLAGKGILEGQGEAFKAASEKYRINEIYLISHAFLETGEGQSKLSRGVKVKGEDPNKRFYNMFGIGAYDKDALKYGSKYAANVGWDTPAKAIVGGAEFIANGYIKENQNTLYTMRWNPTAPGETQYATDIMWAAANANYMKAYYDKLGIEGGKFHFIHYSK